LAWAPIAKDIQTQLSALLSERFIEQTPHSNLIRLPVYLQAIEARLQRAGGRFDFDATARRELEGFLQALMPYWPEYPNPPMHAEAANVRWLLEEYRISLFAQHLGTQGKVSNKRINQLLADLRTQRAAR
jgi:ATP-dependent helicase HrpA